MPPHRSDRAQPVRSFRNADFCFVLFICLFVRGHSELQNMVIAMGGLAYMLSALFQGHCVWVWWGVCVCGCAWVSVVSRVCACVGVCVWVVWCVFVVLLGVWLGVCVCVCVCVCVWVCVWVCVCVFRW